MRIIGNDPSVPRQTQEVASGTLPNGKPVVVNADGTVSSISQSGASAGTPGIYETGAMNQGESRPSAAYDTANGKIVLAYRDENNSNYGTALVGTVSNGSVSFGSAVIFLSASVNYVDTAYDSNAGKVVIVYSDGQSDGNAIVGTVSGTSISFGSPAEFNGTGVSKQSVTYDSTANKVVIAYKGDSQHGHVIVGTVSGTSISFGSDNEWQTAQTNEPTVVYDSNADRSVITYVDASNSDKGAARVGTVSGTSISLGSEVIFHTGTCSSISSCFDSTNNKIVTVFANNGDGRKGTAQVGTVSGTSISYGTAVVFNAASTDDISVDFDSTNGKVIISFADDGDSGKGKAVVGTVSGTSISFTDPIEFESGDTNNHAAAFDPDTNQSIIFYTDISDSEKGKYVTFSSGSTNLTSENYIGMSSGFAESLITSKGTSVAFEGGQSTLIDSTFDSTNNKVVIAYCDNGNNSYGTAVVGTVSGTSISFGTPVVFKSATLQSPIKITYDSTKNRIVIVYKNASSGDDGEIIVGQVSGTSITFGSSVVFDSGLFADGDVVYDSNAQRILISYKEELTSNNGFCVVVSIGGTGDLVPTVNTRQAFHAASTQYISSVYDSTNQKVVIAFRDVGDSSKGKAIVATVGSTSVTFGSEAEFSANAITVTTTSFDSNSGKVVIAYSDSGNSSYGTAIVGTVSGTSISFGSVTVFEAASVSNLSSAFDSNLNKVVISYTDGGNGNAGTLVIGTVSGTSISFDTPFVFDDDVYNSTSVTFDSNSNKIVASFNDDDNSDIGTSAVITVGFDNRGEVADGGHALIDTQGAIADNLSGLTAGQSYFVQLDGTLGTTADDPSVFAGTAVSATKLIVKG